MKKQLIAAIDVGTNSFHIIIASVNARGVFTIHSRDKENVRLGEGSGDMKYLSPEAIDRGVLALKRFAVMAQNAGAEIRAIGTSAMREALNSEIFVRRARDEAGIQIDIINGLEEARLIYLGVLQALPVYEKRAFVIDIGGGSTETVVGTKGEMIFAHSEKIGAIRISRKFFSKERVSAKDIRACREFIRGEWSPVLYQIKRAGFEVAIGSSGTIQTLVAMALAERGAEAPDSYNGVTVTRNEIHQVIHTLFSVNSVRIRAELPGMDPKRADIILGGAMIFEQALEILNIDTITYSGYALREGVLLDTVEKREAISKHHHLSRLRYETVLHLCEQSNVEMKHAEHVKNLALELFDQLKTLHHYGDSERELLEAAAYLHDVGYHLSSDQHHKHSYYIIRNSLILGFTNDEAEIIANIARYHRKSHPKLKHENFQKVHLAQRAMVSLLAGILRIAEGLDRRQQQICRTVETAVEGEKIIVTALYDDAEKKPDIEIWGAERRKILLEEVLEKSVIFHTKQAK